MGIDGPATDGFVSGSTIYRRMCEKDLGVMVDCRLDMSQLCTAATKRANRINRDIVKSQEGIAIFLAALVRLQLEYYIRFWSP